MNGRIGQFERGMMPPGHWTCDPDALVARFGIPRDEAEKHVARALSEEVWINREYQVNIDKSPTHGFPDAVIWHLSIKRRDKRHVHDWRDLQAIKAALCGDEAEAVEIYPAASREVDAANQYHLWVFMQMDDVKRPRIPVGFTDRMVDYSTDRTDGSRQRGHYKKTG